MRGAVCVPQDGKGEHQENRPQKESREPQQHDVHASEPRPDFRAWLRSVMPEQHLKDDACQGQPEAARQPVQEAKAPPRNLTGWRKDRHRDRRHDGDARPEKGPTYRGAWISCQRSNHQHYREADDEPADVSHHDRRKYLVDDAHERFRNQPGIMRRVARRLVALGLAAVPPEHPVVSRGCRATPEFAVTAGSDRFRWSGLAGREARRLLRRSIRAASAK
jgi:hypothetical protein